MTFFKDIIGTWLTCSLPFFSNFNIYIQNMNFLENQKNENNSIAIIVTPT